MGKIFLAHSSKDKYIISNIANKLGKDICTYDELTFEKGYKTINEILYNLDNTDIFVIFISDSSLNSDWVKIEISEAKKRYDTTRIQRILPILIDKSITYEDKRIPDWLIEEYNIKYIGNWNTIVRKIVQKRIELTWELNILIHKKNNLFIGRNKIVDLIEEKMYSMNNCYPNVIIASGFKKIGRKTTVLHTLRKNGIIKEAYRPYSIILNRKNSIDDYILTINDFGVSEKSIKPEQLNTTLDEKIRMAIDLTAKLIELSELLVIEDDGCIIGADNKFSYWFWHIIKFFEQYSQVVIILASRFSLSYEEQRQISNVCHVHIPELDSDERGRLLKRYLEIEEMDFSNEDFLFFKNLQKGYPEQIFYTVDLIKEIGLDEIKKHSFRIIEFNSDRAVKIVEKYGNDEMELLYFISRFEFISFEYIGNFIDNNEIGIKTLSEFINEGICELFGSNKEYIRVNDIIKDYILRTKLNIFETYSKKLKELAKKYFENSNSEDISEYYISTKEALLENPDLHDDRIIPSIYLRTMVDLYDNYKNRYSDIIKLAYRVLEKENNLDDRLCFEIRYWLCLSLARTRDPKFMDEVFKINDNIEHNFLLGFYYRRIGKNINAIERLKIVLDKEPNLVRAKRELVHVYLNMEEYDKAFKLAKENYENEPNNPYFIQCYFSCLIRQRSELKYNNILLDLLERLKNSKNTVALDIYNNCLVYYYGFVEDDEEKALTHLQNIIDKREDTIYIYFTKLEIGLFYKNINIIKESLAQIEKMGVKNSHLNNLFLSKKASLLALEGGNDEAIKIIEGISNYTDEVKERLKARINNRKSF